MYTRRVAKAIGDGNCAFNAFLLGLFAFANDHDLEDKKNENICEKLLDLYEEAFPEYNKTVDNFKIRLSKQKSIKDFENIQKTFSSLLRKLAIELIENDKSNHLNLTSTLLLGAFDEFVKNGQYSEDDIFSAHQFIKEKFEEESIYLDTLKNEDVKALLALWWKFNGHKVFLDELKKDSTWVGDLELKYLSEYFEIDLEVFRDNKIISKSYNCGSLSNTFLNKHYFSALNGIVIEGGDENDPRRLYFRDISQHELVGNLFFLIKEGKLTDEEKELIIDDWKRNHYIRPKIQLINENAIHWDCLADSEWLKPLLIHIKDENINGSHDIKKISKKAIKITDNDVVTGNSFLIDGDDSSDEEMVAYQYANSNLNKKYEIFKENQPEFLKEKDPDGYSFYAFSKGLELLYSPQVNQHYYSKKHKLGENKIYISNKEIGHDKELILWLENTIKDTLENCFKLFKLGDVTTKLISCCFKDKHNKKLIEDFIQNLLKHKRSLFRQKEYAEIIPDIKKYTIDFISSLSDFILKIQDKFFDNIEVTFTIDEFSEDPYIARAVGEKVKKYASDKGLIDDENKLISMKDRKKTINGIINPEKFEKKLLAELNQVNRQNIDNVILNLRNIFCEHYLTVNIEKELQKKKPIIKLREGDPKQYCFVRKDIENSFLHLLKKANKILLDKYMPKKVSEIKETLINRIKLKFDEKFIKNLNSNREEFQIRVDRPMLPEQHCFHSETSAEFLANLRLSYRDQKRQIKQAEDDMQANSGYKNSGEKFHRAWQFGNVKEMALECEEVTSGFSKRDKVINLGRYKIIYENLRDIQTLINKHLKSLDQKKIGDSDVARWMKCVIQHENNFRFTYADKTAVLLDHFQEKELRKILINIVYLIFGCEVLRNPASLVTQAVMIDRIIAGDLSWKNSFFKENIKTIDRKKHPYPITGGGGEMPMSMGKYTDNVVEKKKESEPVAAARTLQNNYKFFSMRPYVYPGDALKEEDPEKKKNVIELARREKNILKKELERNQLKNVNDFDEKVDSWYGLT